MLTDIHLLQRITIFFTFKDCLVNRKEISDTCLEYQVSAISTVQKASIAAISFVLIFQAKRLNKYASEGARPG